MRRILALPRELVDQIAAGEVIERPASVVKELLENAIDAGAARVTIEVEEGGLRLLRVTDDGHGIEPEDLLLAVTSHATSKIATADDLFAIRTLGFRGEALASIAAVSHLRLRSRRRGADAGAELRVDGGRAGEVRPAGMPEGTAIEVADLFYNVPARRAFLRSERGELRAILAEARRQALAHPEVGVTVRADGAVVLEAPATDEPRERLAQLLGRETAEDLLAVPRTAEPVVALRGYASPCDRSRGDSQQQFFVLNGRVVRDPTLLTAVRQAYANLLPPRRHPTAVLWLDVPPDAVDVNVHPQKAEVRFKHDREVFRVVVHAVRAALQQGGLLAELDLPRRRALAPAALAAAGAGQAAARPLAGLEAAQAGAVAGGQAAWFAPGWAPLDAGGPAPSWAPRAASAPATEPAAEPAGLAREAGGAPAPGSLPVAGGTTAPGVAPDAAPALAPPAAGPALGRFVQLHRRYVVEETPEGLRIVDPHAVHERVLYEQIVARVAREPLESQRFLFPLVVDVDPEQVLALADRREALAQLGFEVDPFGRGALAIHAAPRLLAGERAARALVDLLGEPDACDAEALDAPPGAGRLLHELAATLACRAAVRFGDALPDAQLAALLAERARVPNGHCCPHGRPTALHLSLDELDRRFGRQGAG